MRLTHILYSPRVPSFCIDATDMWSAPRAGRPDFRATPRKLDMDRLYIHTV